MDKNDDMRITGDEKNAERFSHRIDIKKATQSLWKEWLWGERGGKILQNLATKLTRKLNVRTLEKTFTTDRRKHTTKKVKKPKDKQCKKKWKIIHQRIGGKETVKEVQNKTNQEVEGNKECMNRRFY